jgi:hypothetical protein
VRWEHEPYGGQTIDLPEFIKRNRERLALKPDDDEPRP